MMDSEEQLKMLDDGLVDYLAEKARIEFDPANIEFRKIPLVIRQQIRSLVTVVDVEQIIEQVLEINQKRALRILLRWFDKAAREPESLGIDIVKPVYIKAPPINKVLPEHKALVESLGLEENFRDVMDILKIFQLIPDGEKAPSFNQVLKTFKTQELAFVKKFFRKPTLILNTKGRSFSELASAMNANAKQGTPASSTSIRGIDQPVIIDGSDFIERFGSYDKVIADQSYFPHAELKLRDWSAYIIDGRGDLEPIGELACGISESDLEWNNSELDLGTRLRHFANYKAVNNLSGMNRWTYAHFRLQLMLNKLEERVDSLGRTILDEDPALSISKVPAAFNHNVGRRVIFCDYSPDESLYGKFRCSVGGVVPMD